MTTPPKFQEFIWNELLSSRPDLCRDFYSRVFGWEAHDTVIEGIGTYTIWAKNGTTIAGMVHSAPTPGQPASAFWGSYIAVENVDRTAQDIIAAGGSIRLMPVDVPDMGRIAVVADPAGALFSIITPVHPAT